MATAFLRQLRKIPSYALPKDAVCPICRQPYEDQTLDSGSFEKALCLPCSEHHVFGSDCLSEWLRHGTSCPLCRHELAFTHEYEHEHHRRIEAGNEDRVYWGHSDQRSQDWDDHWYTTFWLLRLQGDDFTERRWREWQQDWIAAAQRWDRGIAAHTRAAMALSPLTPRKILADERQVRVSAAAIQTLRFREYRLFLKLRPDEAERRELTGPPRFRLSPAQEDALFWELQRREAFKFTPGYGTMGRREQWNRLRDVGFVWNPDFEAGRHERQGRWSRYCY